jgi:hypothetical protein
MWVKACLHYTFCYKKLSRYLYRGVLPDSNIISNVGGQVSFAYISSREQDSQTQTRKVRTLPTVQFLWLVLQHVLPKGLRRVWDSRNKKWLAQR